MSRYIRIVLKSVVGVVCLLALGFAGLVIHALITGKPRASQAASAPVRVTQSTTAAPLLAPAPKTVLAPIPLVPAAPRTPMTSRLDALERASDFVALSALLLDNAAPLSTADRAAAIAWLETRGTNANFPALYMIARLHEVQGSLKEASGAFMAASVVARIDAARCADRSAASAVTALESQFDSIKARLRADTSLAASSLQGALDLEATLAERPPALWIARHGLDVMGGEAPSFVADADWMAKRERMRASLAQSIAGTAK